MKNRSSVIGVLSFSICMSVISQNVYLANDDGKVILFIDQKDYYAGWRAKCQIKFLVIKNEKAS